VCLSACAGGASKYVVVYDVSERVMLRRFAVTSNRSLDGVLDQLHSRWAPGDPELSGILSLYLEI
jgi:periodic tryptophan protein 2